MATAVISGRVDVRVRDRAGAYIRAAGLTQADVIKTVWTNIAESGDVPTEQKAEESEMKNDPIAALEALHESMPEPNPEYAWLSHATPQELKEFLAEERLKDYERLSHA